MRCHQKQCGTFWCWNCTYSVAQMSVCFLWKVKTSPLLPSSSGEVWEPQLSLASIPLMLDVYWVFLKISTHILSCCSSPPTCWTNSVSLFYIYFQALQRFQTNHTDFLSLPEFSLCSYVQIHNKTKGNTSWKSFPILSIST